MNLRRLLIAGLWAGLATVLPATAALGQGQPAIAPNLGATEAPCNPPCGDGYACRGGVCEPTSAPAAAASPADKMEKPTTGETAPAVAPAAAAVAPEPRGGDENLLPPWIHTSDFVDTRLSFLFADNNVLAKPGETTPNSPGAGIAGGGQTAQFNQFYDNFNTRYTGFETLSNLVLYKKSDSYFHGLSAEAALALTILVTSGTTNTALPTNIIQDASSYIRLNYAPPAWDPKTEGISFVGFPLSADRMRLGYAYTISWGGSNVFPNQGNSVPGAKLQINKTLGGMPVYAYGGVKTTLIENAQIHEQETNYGFLGGAGIDVLPVLRIEANGGYFQKGVNPEPQVLGVPVNSRGIAGEVVYHQGQPIGYSADFALYQNDPNHYINFFKPEAYPGGLSYSVSLEGDFLQQTLTDPDIFGATKTQSATAAALQARFKYDNFRFNILALYRTLSYLQFNGPGFPPFFDFPASTTETPEAFFAVGGDYYITKAHLTLGAIGGLQHPSSLTTTNLSQVLPSNNPPDNLNQIGARTVVFSDAFTYSILPDGAVEVNVLSVKGTARLDISDYVAAVGQIYYTRNNNLTTFKDDVLGVSEPSFQKPDILGFNVLLQARF